MKIKGIKQAVGDFNNWLGQARIYFDENRMEVWTEVYPGGNESWTEYEDEAISEVCAKVLLQDHSAKIRMKEVEVWLRAKMSN